MKIYIDKLNLDILNDIAELFKEYLVQTNNYISLFTNENIYHIENKQSFVLDVVDNKIETFENYFNGFTLITDASYFNKTPINSILGHTHLSFNIKEYRFKLDIKSSLELVIKFNLMNKISIPNDIYFEINKDVDVNETFIKNEIIEFLSVLN